LRAGTEKDAYELRQRIASLCGGVTPETWSFDIAPERAAALYASLDRGDDVRLRHLQLTPSDRKKSLPCIPLLLARGDRTFMLPDPDTQLQCGDRVLFTARAGTRRVMSWALNNPKALEYVVTGNELPDGTVWRWLAQRKARV
jgi:voltage-gated potassium channel